MAAASSLSRRPRPASSRIACGSVLMPTPSSRIESACSYNSQSMPRARSIKAVVTPPIPPPTMSAFIARTPHKTRQDLASGCHGPSLRRKRLCPLRLQFDPGLGLSLNLEVFEILPVAHAVAENLFLAGQILHRAGHVHAVPGGCLDGEGRVDQMRPAERDEIGAAGGQD